MSTQLPTITDLHHDVQKAFKNDQLNLLLNQPPHASWVKKHPMTKGDYLPIDKIEFMLTRIFQEWHVEVKGYSQLFQSVACHIRLHLKNPLNGEWFYQDGVGASPVQVDAGKDASDMGAIKSAAVQMALPSAETYAIKDAAEKLGSLFGKDLNRKDIVMFAGAFDTNHTNGHAVQPMPQAETAQQSPASQSTPSPSTPSFTPQFNFSAL